MKAFFFTLLLSCFTWTSFSQIVQYDYDSTAFCFNSNVKSSCVDTCSPAQPASITLSVDLDSFTLYFNGEQRVYTLDKMFSFKDEYFILKGTAPNDTQVKLFISPYKCVLANNECNLQFKFIACKEEDDE